MLDLIRKLSENTAVDGDYQPLRLKFDSADTGVTGTGLCKRTR